MPPHTRNLLQIHGAVLLFGLAGVLGKVLALAGVAVLAPSAQLGDRTTQGVLWGVASGLTFALLSLCNRKYARQHPSITIAFYQDLVAAAVLLPFVVMERPTLGLREVML